MEDASGAQRIDLSPDRGIAMEGALSAIITILLPCGTRRISWRPCSVIALIPVALTAVYCFYLFHSFTSLP